MFGRWFNFWVNPKDTLFRVSGNHFNDAFAIIGVYLGLRLLAGAPKVYSWVLLAPHAPAATFRKVYRYLWDQGRYDMWILLGVAAVFWSFSRFILKRPVTMAGALNVVAYCALPLLLWIGASILLARLGYNEWWGAHHPVDQLRVLVVDRRVSFLRFFTKCGLAYGPPAAVFGAWMWSQFRHRKDPVPKTGASAVKSPPFWAKALVVCVLLGTGIGATGASIHHLVSQKETLKPVVPGQPLPTMTLPVLDSAANIPKKTLTNSDLKGKVVLLDFWATWCPPCMRAMPELEKLHRKLKGQGVVFVGINRQPYARPAVKAKIEALGLTFAQVMDQKTGRTDGFGERMGVQSLPTSFLVDPSGQVRKIHIGYTEINVLEQEIRALLAE